ncbi:hypothetical protein E0W68_10840 [Flavobacterium salilacus subsp. salilacus]|uniref:hypothetical protein n=1 Tax=Flavobacterium TaxID=237 RepID=UPI0010756EAA|nr:MULTISPECIES: hypothetical protein [Flavobacterium]KAF2517460.1 hypothetical protein E0W68_10840 [Flavobacterium salilacus subsp. salilacus]MBE1615604.1 hypothetical protein [Flavobacterium sp. SaA2.13]
MKDKKNIISLETAQAWAKKWRKEEGTYNSHHEVHAFLIPKEDLTELLSEGVDAVRAYLGVDEHDEEKLMIVGTKYNAATDTYVDMTPERVVHSGYIYDFTRPCPPSCDTSSPLN